MKTIGLDQKTLGKAIRPPKQDNFALPDRKVFETGKNTSLAQHLKDVPALNDEHEARQTSIIDEILLSLAWNNPSLADVPVLGASTVDTPSSNHEQERQAKVDQKSGNVAVEQFLLPSSMESLVMPSTDEHMRNARSLYKMAISSALRKNIKLTPGN